MNKVVMSVLFLFLVFVLHAQMSYEEMHTKSIAPFRLAISNNKTTNLLFAYPVIRIHCGSPGVNIEQMKEVKNILLVRSMSPQFPETNLSVVTSDGKFYSFLLHYAPEPSMLNIRFVEDSTLPAEAPPALLAYGDLAMNKIAEQIKIQKRFIRLVDREQCMKFSLQSILLHKETMWFNCSLGNHSLIHYRPDYVRFIIRDRKRSKRTVVQERELTPVFLSVPQSVPGDSQANIVAAFEPFTIASDKMLVIQLGKRMEGGSLELKAGSKTLLKTRMMLH